MTKAEYKKIEPLMSLQHLIKTKLVLENRLKL